MSIWSVAWCSISQPEQSEIPTKGSHPTKTNLKILNSHHLLAKDKDFRLSDEEAKVTRSGMEPVSQEDQPPDAGQEREALAQSGRNKTRAVVSTRIYAFSSANLSFSRRGVFY